MLLGRTLNDRLSRERALLLGAPHRLHRISTKPPIQGVEQAD